MRVRYRYIGAVRHKVGFSREVAPIATDTNESFERRMAAMAEKLLADGHGVDLTFELKGEQLVGCIVDVTLSHPTPAPIVVDLRPAGQRRGGRGGGGGQRMAA